MYRRLLLISTLLVLSACSSLSSTKPGYSPVSQVDFSELYLRGVFNWWEARPAFQLQRGASGWYVDVELIADGQPYDFRLTDANWTSSQTCGSEQAGQAVISQETVYMVCGDLSQNLQFTPGQTGVYRFRFARSGNALSLSIAKR